MPLAYDPSRTALYHPERRDTLFVRGQTYSPLQLAIEAARLAYYRAEVSPAERARLADALAPAPACFVFPKIMGEEYQHV